MSKLPYKSGLPLTEAERPDTRTINQIVESAIRAKRFRKSLHQRYSKEATPETRKVNNRMFPDN